MLHHIESERKVFWSAVLTMIVGGVGVGIFGLPFVFSQSGALVGLSYLIGLGITNTIILVAFADLLAGTKEHSRLSGVVERYLGKGAGLVMTILSFLAGWGALLAYFLVGGEFVYELLSPVIGGSLVLYQLLFFSSGSVLLLGGIGFIGKLETLLSVVLLVMLAVLLGGSVGDLQTVHLLTVDWIHWFAPFGVVLFALNGLAAIPEMSDILGDYRADLRKAVIVGASGIILIYALFAMIVVGVTGGATSEAAIDGLSLVVGKWTLILGGIVVFFATFTSFLLVGVSLVESLVFDYKWKLIPAWLMSVIAPLVIFLIGARSFIEVLSIVGAFVFGTTGLIVVATYISAKKDAWLPKRHFHYPVWPLYISTVVLLGGIIATIIEFI